MVCVIKHILNPKRKDTQVPQPSGPTEDVADEAIHKELGDNLVRAATTASSLEVEQDSGGSRTHRLKRIRKVGVIARVESSSDEENLGDDASKQGRRINDIDADEDISLNENFVKEVVDAAQVSTAAITITITTEEITLAQALADLKSTKPKAKGIAFREPEPEKPLKKKDQLKYDEEIALKLQVKIDEEERIARTKEENIDEANIALTEEWDDIQAKIKDDHELA
ncbi:hypothetical protein Tco_0941449 [Tanacetum coccineum]|uniref:Uncharacterized protein n=1 Tax=Tanacetum coccineum TaxID=301880 RepID=A0ABQ5DRU1_9ASTR